MRTMSGTAYDEQCSSFSASDIYTIEVKLDKNIYTFDEGFVHLVRYALSTFCISEMSESELEFFNMWIDWINGIQPYTEPIGEFDQYMVDLTMCRASDYYLECGYSIDHDWTPCPILMQL